MPSWANVSTPTIALQFQREPAAVELQQGVSKHRTHHTHLREQSEEMKVKCYTDFPGTGTSLEIRNQVPTTWAGRAPMGAARHISRDAGGADPHQPGGSKESLQAVPNSASVLCLVLKRMFTTFLQRVRRCVFVMLKRSCLRWLLLSEVTCTASPCLSLQGI